MKYIFLQASGEIKENLEKPKQFPKGLVRERLFPRKILIGLNRESIFANFFSSIREISHKYNFQSLFG